MDLWLSGGQLPEVLRGRSKKVLRNGFDMADRLGLHYKTSEGQTPASCLRKLPRLGDRRPWLPGQTQARPPKKESSGSDGKHRSTSVAALFGWGIADPKLQG